MNTLTPLQTLWQFVRPQAFAAAPADLALVARICERRGELRSVADRVLRERAEELSRELVRLPQAVQPSSLEAAFIILREAARRVLGVEFYEVQLLAGIALCRGAIAEMQTGEGKTLTAALPTFFHALGGQKVHLATPNAYLAARDCELLMPLYRMLGLSAGLLRERVSNEEKRAAYACDIVYGTGYEFGFDYLRDQIALLSRPAAPLGERHRHLLRGQLAAGPELLQSGHACAIIDEIDSVLIDEACMPLILSAPVSAASDKQVYLEALKAAAALEPDLDFSVDEVARRVHLTERGIRNIHRYNLRSLELERPWTVYVQQALQASLLFKRDVDYVVAEGKILLVDQFTGRIFPDRSWRDGLHQAVEAKEGLTINDSHKTTARISRQRYFKLYKMICGMTGTAQGCQREFWNLYRLPVVVVPPRLPSERILLPTRYFASAQTKWEAVTRDVQSLHHAGRPVLIGSRTIENSQLLARSFDAAGLPYQLLNGTQDEEEAHIVGRAGQTRAITIATNMAGRGTDIKLGEGVAAVGGLHVIGLEHNESPRIDRQLVGRAARQGDPGSAQFFASGEDSLVARFAPELAGRMHALASPDGEIRADLAKEFATLQRRAEAEHYAQRRGLLSYHDWVDDVLAKLVKEK